jgi:TetR/AcrR family transcriptional regulator, fatty acid metabolism regulator protein
MQETDGQPRQSLKERQRQEREELILQTAEEVLTERGYYNMSMDEIASRVGIAKGTLYHHFARKEDLAFALFERFLEESVVSLEEIGVQEGTPQERLQALLNSMYGRIYGARLQFFFSLFHGLDFYHILQQRDVSLNEVIKRVALRLTRLIDEGKADGSFDPEIPTPILVTIFLSLVSPKAFKRLIVDDNIDPVCIAEHISRFFFRGIATPIEDDSPPK